MQQSLDQERDLFCFHPRRRGGVQLIVIFLRCDQSKFDAGIVKQTRSIRLNGKRNIRRLNGRFRYQERIEDAVDHIKDLFMASEVGPEFTTERPAAFHPFDDMVEGLDISPAKGVDGLFGQQACRASTWATTAVLARS